MWGVSSRNHRRVSRLTEEDWKRAHAQDPALPVGNVKKQRCCASTSHLVGKRIPLLLHVPAKYPHACDEVLRVLGCGLQETHLLSVVAQACAVHDQHQSQNGFVRQAFQSFALGTRVGQFRFATTERLNDLPEGGAPLVEGPEAVVGCLLAHDSEAHVLQLRIDAVVGISKSPLLVQLSCVNTGHAPVDPLLHELSKTRAFMLARWWPGVRWRRRTCRSFVRRLRLPEDLLSEGCRINRRRLEGPRMRILRIGIREGVGGANGCGLRRRHLDLLAGLIPLEALADPTFEGQPLRHKLGHCRLLDAGLPTPTAARRGRGA
mmetsp:Transcript_52412/g.152536  ORF Transcript_52412/g.152536 Transcript_52412/m.152536 type:complete len:319 (+) Transcript_52412:50-1006(+)